MERLLAESAKERNFVTGVTTDPDELPKKAEPIVEKEEDFGAADDF